MEKAMNDLDVVEISKHNFRRTLDSLQEGARSLLLLSVQWKEIEGYFDSTRTLLEERANELQKLEESIKAKALALEAKEKEVEQLEIFAKRVESMEKFSDEKFKELEARAKELELRVKQVQIHKEEAGEKLRLEFEPLVSLLPKEIVSPATCSTIYPNEKVTDDLVKRNLALARMVPCLDPGKIVLDAVQGSLKGFREANDTVVNSCILLLEKLIVMTPKITPKVKEQATQLGVDWIDKAKSNPKNHLLVLGCLLFLAAYGLAFVTTRHVLLSLLGPFLSHDHAPKLFRLLNLGDAVSGVVKTLKKNDKYLAVLRFICEFRLYKLCPKGRPGALLIEYLDSSEKAARVIAGTGDSMEEQIARREKRKADAVMALECIKEKKAELMFPARTLKMLIAIKNDESAHERVREPVHKSNEERKSATDTVEKSASESIIPRGLRRGIKRPRFTEPITPLQNSSVPLNHPVDQFEGMPVPSGGKIEESGVSHEVDVKATYPLSTETKPNIPSGSINGDMLRELLEKNPLEESDISNAIKCTPDPAKLVLDTSMAICPTKHKGGYEFKLLITSANCSLLLDQLKKLSPQIGHPVKGNAKELAVYWKDKISKSKTNELEAVCFLQFLGVFGIVSEFKANDLLGLLDGSYWRTGSPDLCQFLDLVNAIPGFIEHLIKSGHRLKAVYYIYSFDMVNRFHPVSDIIKDSLRITKESAEKSFRDAENDSALRVAAIDRQIKSLRAAIRCISCHKLEAEFQLENLKEQIKSLLKLKEKPSEIGSVTSITPLAHVSEIGSSTSNTPLEPSTVAASSSVSKPNKKKGRNRSLSDNRHGSVHVASHPSNNYPIPMHGYSLNQRETWSVDRYPTSYTGGPNSDYNYNQWTQPEESQYYQFYQHHHNPFYRSHF